MSDSIRYFEEASGQATESGRFVGIDKDLPAIAFAPGLLARALVGRNLLASFVSYEPHSHAPLHAHEEEQIFIVMDGEKRLMRPGDAALIPAFVPHSARTYDGAAYQIDVFSPPRKALLAMLEARDQTT